jgi:hypothetical protein
MVPGALAARRRGGRCRGEVSFPTPPGATERRGCGILHAGG